jgi:hypothetical protein
MSVGDNLIRNGWRPEVAVLDDTGRLHNAVAEWFWGLVLDGERPHIVVNGPSKNGIVFTTTGRVLMYVGDSRLIWAVDEVETATLQSGTFSTTLKLSRGPGEGIRRVDFMLNSDGTAKQSAEAALTFIRENRRGRVEAAIQDRQAEFLERRGLETETRPLVLIKAYGAVDPGEGKKASMFVRQLPSKVLADANLDARILATDGYFPVAMAWYDAGSEASSMAAYNAGVREQQLVLTITYRLDVTSGAARQDGVAALRDEVVS